jgi:hypothetical protein
VKASSAKSSNPFVSLRNEKHAEDSQQHGESEHIEKEQDNGDECAAALSGSFDLAQGEVSNYDCDGPKERAK